jgi:hypothetical protein
MSNIEQLEQQLMGNKERMSLRDAVVRLTQNADFRRVIIEEFSTRDCARLVQESADPLLRPEERADALAMAQAAGHLKRWIINQIQFGDTAAAQISDLEETIEIARSEDA